MLVVVQRVALAVGYLGQCFLVVGQILLVEQLDFVWPGPGLGLW